MEIYFRDKTNYRTLLEITMFSLEKNLFTMHLYFNTFVITFIQTTYNGSYLFDQYVHSQRIKAMTLTSQARSTQEQKDSRLKFLHIILCYVVQYHTNKVRICYYILFKLCCLAVLAKSYPYSLILRFDSPYIALRHSTTINLSVLYRPSSHGFSLYCAVRCCAPLFGIPPPHAGCEI